MGTRFSGHVGRLLALAVGTTVALTGACTTAPAPVLDRPGSTAAVPGDPALASWSVLPPGNGNVGGFTSRWSDNQRGAYDRIIDATAAGALTDADLGSYFVDARMGARDVVRTDRPAPGVTVQWDANGIPHVHGDTSRDVAWGAGWVVAETRLLVAELGRILGRAGTIEMGGGLTTLMNDFSRLADLPQVNYTDAELLANLDDAVARAGADGPEMLEALDGFVDGLNTWVQHNTFPPELQELGIRVHRWNRADVLAVGLVVDDIFGSGGGGEVDSAATLAGLTGQLGEAGREVFDLLRMAEQPGATTHVDSEHPYPVFEASDGVRTATAAVDPAAVALPDAGAGPAGVPAAKPQASNYVAISGERSAAGHPILVGGPQSSYFAPQLLLEMELSGGGYDARGITFPGLGPWVVIGRSRQYAWTATAGGSDLTDERVELLCEPDGSIPTHHSRHYLFHGGCVAMSRPDARPGTAWRTVHGPVTGTTTVDGRPVAISRQRSSRGQAAHAARAFWQLNRAGVESAEDFAPVMSDIPMSFNWVYVDAHDIAYFHSGWYPVRALGVDPDLPSWGTGQWEWQGLLDWRDQPQAVNPGSGYLVSWNNAVAPGWRAADNDWATGSVQRVDMLVDRVEPLAHATPADVVSAVQEAATLDMRGDQVLDTIWAALGESPAPSDVAGEARTRLAAWQAAGSHRHDLDSDGFHDDSAVALMDAFYVDAVESVFGPGLGTAVTDPRLRRPRSFDNAPSMTGGAYAKGWYSLLVRDLVTVSGADPEGGAPALVFCGAGDLGECRRLLWAALERSAGRVGSWPSATFREQIRFLPIITNTATMRWQNRPTWQQVVSFGD